MMKKLLKIVLTLGILTIIPICSATDTPHERYNGNEGRGVNTQGKVSGVETIGTDDVNTDNGSRIIDVIQRTINRVLGMLSFVALILCLRGGFQMLIAGGDDAKVKAGTKVLKNAAIGLAVIGLARLAVSFIFRIVNKVSNNTP